MTHSLTRGGAQARIRWRFSFVLRRHPRHGGSSVAGLAPQDWPRRVLAMLGGRRDVWLQGKEGLRWGVKEAKNSGRNRRC